MSGKLRFYRKFLPFAGLTALAVAGAVLAYSPRYTHPDLTEEMVKFYNASGQQKIGSEFLQALRQGSIDEDIDPRWINHFYDPQSGEGWTGEHLGPHSKKTVQGVSNTLVAMNFTPMSAPKWAEDQAAQNKFINYGWNHTWQKAIYDYVGGNEKDAFESLGYILHLIEDMSVPDHTRNDSHPHVAGDPGSPYEEWAKSYTNSNKLDTAEKLLSEKNAIPQFSNLKEAFDYTAKYSNENFFSEETITDVKYSKPAPQNPVADGINSYIYYSDDNFGKYPTMKSTRLENNSIKYTINDDRILSVYFSRLSRRSVLAGAGVIELFFKEAEKAKNNPSALEKPPPPPTAMGTLGVFMLTRVVSPLGLISPLARSLYASLRSAFNLASVTEIFKDKPSPSQLVSEIPQNAFIAVLPPRSSRPSPEATAGTATLGVFPSGVEEENHSNILENVGMSQMGGNTESGSLPPFLQLQAVGSSAGFGGGGSPTPSVQTAVSNVAADITPPDISFSITECSGSLSSDGCLVASSTVSVSWSSAASDLNRYIVECALNGLACGGFNFASTTATSTIYSLPTDDSTYIFKAKAVDNAGNESAQTTKTVEFLTRPVVINEVAWAGTSASFANDEWIELYNKSSQSVNLANWVLYANDGVPYINLSGTISAGGYYLIERTNDNTVSDIIADLAVPFSGTGSGSGLGNSGEILILSKASTTIDQTVLCSGTWCGGAAGGAYPSMERIDPDIAGTNSTNWGTSNSGASNGFIKNGKDSAGANLTATPRARNSLDYLISQNSTLPVDSTLKKSRGIYIIRPDEDFTVPAGKTLTIEPGVTVKMGSGSKLLVNGTLISNGSASERVVFTALDGARWRTVKITSSSVNSSISYTNFSIGGEFLNNTLVEERAMLSVVSASPAVSNSVFENSLSAGARFVSSNSSISSNTFSAGTTSADMAGIFIHSGSPTVSGNTFSENYYGFKAEGGSASVSDNVFTNNISYAAYSSSAANTFSGNSGSGNGKNGITLLGTVSVASGTTTLSANSLPYITQSLDDAKVSAGSVLVLEGGVKFAGEDGSSRFVINGTLKLEGANKDSIIFTSLADSSPEEWGGILVNAGGYVYGGGFTLRYGGKAIGCPSCAGFRVFGGSVALSDGRIEKNALAGMRLYDKATSTLTNFEFNNHTTPTGNSTALIAANAGVILDTVSFSNNLLGVSSSNSTIQATGVTFSGNTTNKSPANAF